jgi:hypothetical protein
VSNLSELEKQIWASAFAWAIAWGHDDLSAAERAERAVLAFRRILAAGIEVPT